MTLMCSADSHVVEPADVWVQRMPRSLRDRAPRYESRGDVQMAVIDGRDVMPISSQAFAMADGSELRSDDVPKRLELLDRDGVWAEALIGNLAGTVVFGLEEPDFAMACARAYNDWLAETFVPYSDRQLGIAFVPVCGEVADSVKEIERLASLGLRGFALPLWSPEPYHLAKFEPIWATAAELGLPISFHAHTGTYFRERFLDEDKVPVKAPDTEPRSRDAVKTAAGFADSSLQAYQASQVTGWFVGAGVLERYPDLHLVFVECGAAWLVSALDSYDFAWQQLAGADRTEGLHGGAFDVFEATGWKYPLSPSEYVHRQVHVTFMDEPAAVRYRHEIGIEQLMWGSDMPHPEGTWPHSQEFVAKLCAGVDEAERAAMLGGNFARLYGLRIPAMT